ncbi:MAG: hypothetical protein QXG05_04100 [Nitrososphaerota archaeon]
MLRLTEDKIKEIVKIAMKDRQAAIATVLSMQDTGKDDYLKGIVMALKGINIRQGESNLAEHIAQIIDSLPLEDIDLAYLKTWSSYLELMDKEGDVEAENNKPYKNKRP